ncbi:hypothetical protein C8R47DRAFT_123188 [Mycena vitilis]|nr:hypothetical protein C8R47DRAFT_123188 [Mycena vitilis]
MYAAVCAARYEFQRTSRISVAAVAASAQVFPLFSALRPAANNRPYVRLTADGAVSQIQLRAHGCPAYSRRSPHRHADGYPIIAPRAQRLPSSHRPCRREPRCFLHPRRSGGEADSSIMILPNRFREEAPSGHTQMPSGTPLRRALAVRNGAWTHSRALRHELGQEHATVTDRGPTILTTIGMSIVERASHHTVARIRRFATLTDTYRPAPTEASCAR